MGGGSFWSCFRPEKPALEKEEKEPSQLSPPELALKGDATALATSSSHSTSGGPPPEETHEVEESLCASSDIEPDVAPLNPMNDSGRMGDHGPSPMTMMMDTFDLGEVPGLRIMATERHSMHDDAILSSRDGLHVYQSMFAKVTALIQKLAGESGVDCSHRPTPLTALRKALKLILEDCNGTCASIALVSDSQSYALLAAAAGTLDKEQREDPRLVQLPGSGTSLEALSGPEAEAFVHWSRDSSVPQYQDWDTLVGTHTGGSLHRLYAVPIQINKDKVAGVLTMGFAWSDDSQELSVWKMYLQLVAASLCNLLRQQALNLYLDLVRSLQDAQNISALVHGTVGHLREAMGHRQSHQIWYRLALMSADGATAFLFDDFTQIPANIMQTNGTGSYSVVLRDLAQGGVMHTVVPTKHTVMKVAMNRRQQVIVPDVQKLINQSGVLCHDIFNIRIVKPPTSVLLSPLRNKERVFGVVFCMSSVQTDFSDVSAALKEACELASPHIMQRLAMPAFGEQLLAMQLHAANSANHAAMDLPPPSSSSPQQPNSRMSFGMATSEAGTSPRNVFDSPARGSSGGTPGAPDTQSQFLESLTAASMNAAFTATRSSTGALVTGITEKLNQKRIQGCMDIATTNKLTDLQMTRLLGEGGFAKVFRGAWRGLVVGVKVVVCSTATSMAGKEVMKNAHEIAILSTVSHPNIVQAYTCMTDVLVRDVMASCFQMAETSLLTSTAFKFLMDMGTRECHLQVIELADMGNLAEALKRRVFNVPAATQPSVSSPLSGNSRRSMGAPTGLGSQSSLAAVLNGWGAVDGVVGVNMRALLLTLIEIASACCHLHHMGIVHCDLKPANVLLKTSASDSRGYTVLVSDFGLSRVQDDESCSSFPFNSCGTAAYVAPEALMSTKKVNTSVDVYAYGILMWEMYTAQRPYGSLKPQQVVDEVVNGNLRPVFPLTTPPAYVCLAEACWAGLRTDRPTFDDVLTCLNDMLQVL